jgi:ribosomal-protein-alanine N-acetyltransferase
MTETFPRLESKRLSLTVLELSDAQRLFEIFSQQRVVEHMDIDQCPSVDEAQSIIRWTQEIRDDETGIRWGIRLRSDGTLIGTCGFNSIVRERGSRAEIAYDLDPRFWGQGFMAEVMPHLEAYGFEVLGLRRLEAMVTPGNERSCLLLERHGFQREGILRDYARWKGQFWDQWIYAKLGGEGRVAT